MSRTVRIAAPSRLHFGLWSLAGGTGRQFGGVGAMAERPGLRLKVTSSAGLEVHGLEICGPLPLAERARVFVRRWALFHRLAVPACRIEIECSPPEHAGLGTGTQLGLSLAAGLGALCGLPSQSPQELALSVGRGMRSAVGTYGFVQGGLIVEQGKLPGEPISPLDCRIDLPEDWRFVLVRPIGLTGLAGEDESTAIASLPAIAPAVTDRLVTETRDQLVPAAATSDFPTFAASLFRYGNLSGQCFAARQGGPYNGPILTRLVDQIRSLGAEGVGQSSWGPTLFVAQPNQAAAEDLTERIAALPGQWPLELVVTPPANRGARVEVTA
jgi:beta-RFAP synthase